jgi:hypothetical protein
VIPSTARPADGSTWWRRPARAPASVADHLGEQHAEPFVRARHPPAAIGGRVDGVLAPRSTATPRRRRGLDDETGVDEAGQVPAHGVVAESEMCRPHGGVGWPITVDDVPEDAVPSRVAERSRLLQRRHSSVLSATRLMHAFVRRPSFLIRPVDILSHVL